MRYRQRADVEVVAIQWTGENLHEIHAIAAPTRCELYPYAMVVVLAGKDYGDADEGSIGDWLIADRWGLRWLGHDAFEYLYEATDGTNPEVLAVEDAIERRNWLATYRRTAPEFDPDVLPHFPPLARAEA